MNIRETINKLQKALIQWKGQEMDGQISIFDIFPMRKVNEKNECLGEPCMYCDTEWGSLNCFLKRGYIWDRVNRFIKDDNGKCLRRSIEMRDCKKVYEDEP